MRVGASVIVRARWSSFFGMAGKVTQTKPFLMVLIEGERRPMRFGDREVVEQSRTRHIAGAE